MLRRHVVEWQHDEVAPANQPKLDDIGDRVWYALHCLPRDEHGRAPPPTRFEKPEGEISRVTLSKLISGARQSVDPPTLVKIGKALGVSVGFLADAEQPWPKPTGPIPPRPKRFDANKKPIRVRSAIEATGVVLDRLGLEQHDAEYLSTPGEHEMNRLPPDGRDAAMATVYLEGCTVQQAAEAALAALAHRGENGFGEGPDGWMRPIREALLVMGVKRSRSSVRRIAVAPAPPRPAKSK